MPKVTRDLSTLKVNEIWVGDGHTLAILTPHNNSLRRFTLSAMLDMRSRAMVGWCIGKHSSSYVIGLAVRHGILPKDDSPIYGLPGFVYIDNGKDYRSKHLNGGTSSTLFDFTLEQEGLFKALGIGTKFTTPYFPWAKPIERQFQTFSSEMSRYITGFCGETIDERPYDLKEKEILVSGLTIEQVAKIVEGYMRVYNNTPHSSLDGKTPLEVYNSAPKYREDMPREEELDILLLKADRVKITDSGIKKFGVWFWDDAMIHHIGEWATVRFDPNRMGEMYVYVNGELCCKAANKELLDMNASEEKIKEWKKKQAKARKEVKEAIQGYGVSAGDARRMVLEDYTDDEEILDIVCGRNKPGRSNSKVIRVNRFTREGKKISGADISGPGVNSSPANDFFARMGEQFFESTK
jgi:putative transposase